MEEYTSLDSVNSNWRVIFLENTNRRESKGPMKLDWLLNFAGFVIFPICIVLLILLIPLEDDYDYQGSSKTDLMHQINPKMYIVFQIMYNIFAFFTIITPFICAIPSSEGVMLIPFIFGAVGIFGIYYYIFFVAPKNLVRVRVIVSLYRLCLCFVLVLANA